MTKKHFDKKRFLHILHIIYDILATLFIVVVSGALIYNSVIKNNDHLEGNTPKVQSVEVYNDYKKSKLNVAINSLPSHENYCILTQGDFLSSDFIFTLIDYMVVDNLYDDFSYNSNNDISAYWSSSEPSTSLDAGLFISNVGISSSNSTEVRSIRLQHEVQGASNNQHKYTLSFYNVYSGGDSSSLLLQFTYYIMRQLQTYVDGVEVNQVAQNVLSKVDYYSSIDRLYQLNGWYYYEKSYQTHINALYNVAYAMYEHRSPSYDNGYQLGFRTGYDKGYIDGSNGIETNAFTIIGQAFSSVVNVFNVDVLPGLPLWTLVFAPLIIAVIIVVIKVIKG